MRVRRQYQLPRPISKPKVAPPLREKLSALNWFTGTSGTWASVVVALAALAYATWTNSAATARREFHALEPFKEVARAHLGQVELTEFLCSRKEFAVAQRAFVEGEDLNAKISPLKRDEVAIETLPAIEALRFDTRLMQATRSSTAKANERNPTICVISETMLRRMRVRAVQVVERLER